MFKFVYMVGLGIINTESVEFIGKVNETSVIICFKSGIEKEVNVGNADSFLQQTCDALNEKE